MKSNVILLIRTSLTKFYLVFDLFDSAEKEAEVWGSDDEKRLGNTALNERERVEAEIENNEKSGIMRKVEYAEWASPMVTVRKPNEQPF